MTLPVHDINYVKASHRKFQFITILFTVVTLAATLGAAFSGIQLSNLKQETIDSEKVTEEAAAPPKTPAIADDSAMKEIEALKSELAMERSGSLKLKAKIKNLNNQISSLKKAAVASRTPKPKAAPSTQPKPATPIVSPQKKEPVTVAPPAPPQSQPHQKVAPPPEPETTPNKGQEPSAPAPHQPDKSNNEVPPQSAPTSPPEMPANEAVTPSVDSVDKSLPASEPEQPSTPPPVAAPPSQPQSTDDNPATTGAGEPDSNVNQ
jgi:hypothetical protein